MKLLLKSRFITIICLEYVELNIKIIDILEYKVVKTAIVIPIVHIVPKLPKFLFGMSSKPIDNVTNLKYNTS